MGIVHHLKWPILSIAIALMIGGISLPVEAADGLPPAPTYIPGTRIAPEQEQPDEAAPDKKTDIIRAGTPEAPVGRRLPGEAASGLREPSKTGNSGLDRGADLDALDPYIPAPGQWSLIPGSAIAPALPTEAELGADLCEQIKCNRALSVLTAWNALGYDEATHCLWALAGGGHADYGGNEAYRYCLRQPENGWKRITDPAPLTRAPMTKPDGESADQACPAPAAGPMASHTYDGVIWIPGSTKFLWLGSFGFCRGSMGPSSAWIFDSSTSRWTELPGLDKYARFARTGIDPASGDIVVFARDTLRAIDPKNLDVKWATHPIGNLGAGNAIVHPQRREIYLLAKGAIYSAKLDVPADEIIVRKIANFPEIKSAEFGMAVHDPTGDIVMWDGRRSVYAYDVENQTLAALPSVGQTPSEGNVGHVYSQWVYLPEKDIFLGVTASEGVWIWRRGSGQSGSPAKTIDYAQAGPPAKPADRPFRREKQAATAGAPPDASFADLCAKPETLLCDPLDDSPISGPAIAPSTKNLTMTETIDGRYGDWRWAWSKPNSITPQIDPEVKADGQGSLKFTVASQSPAGGSSLYTVAISPDASLGVGAGEGIRARLKVRWSCDVLYVDCDPASPTYKQERRHYAVTKGSGGIKVFAIGEADRPNEYLDSGEGLSVPVIGNYKQKGFFAGYISIWEVGIQQAQSKINGIRQLDLQPGGPHVCWKNDPVTGRDIPKGSPECFYFESDQWMTLQMDLLYGGCTKDVGDPALASLVRLWVAREGEPFELVIDQPVNIRCAPKYPDAKFGKIWITPYNTGKNRTEVHPEGYIWYDSLWVSKIGE